LNVARLRRSQPLDRRCGPRRRSTKRRTGRGEGGGVHGAPGLPPSDRRRAGQVGGERGRVRPGGAAGRRLGKRAGLGRWRGAWAGGRGGWRGGGPHLALHGVASGPVPTGQVGVVRAGDGDRGRRVVRESDGRLDSAVPGGSLSATRRLVVMVGQPELRGDGRRTTGPGFRLGNVKLESAAGTTGAA
jgi:hypothetical protein